MTGNLLRLLIAGGASYAMWRVGRGLLGGFARPTLPPEESGQLRKVNLKYRCDICGTEVKMTMGTDELPPPPRHCLDEMTLVTPTL